eukprot:660678-Amphidinium_carterae.1
MGLLVLTVSNKEQGGECFALLPQIIPIFVCQLLGCIAKQLQRSESRERHPNDERSQGVRNPHKQLRGNSPRERAPSDAGREQIRNPHE